jgi:UDP-N-acetyl-2-amino-2-deoxyglucuronate dehydrogenase
MRSINLSIIKYKKIISLNKVNFAVIGCGHIGKRHAEMIQRNSVSNLVALCDVLPKEQLKVDHFEVPVYSTLVDMLDAHPEIEVVNIATPNGFHCEHSLMALDHCKHVVIEKPLALTKSDAEKVIFKALQVNKQVFAVMQNRYSPPSVWIKEMVENGQLGKLYMVQLNCYWNRDDRYYETGSWHGSKEIDGGTLFTQFSHFIDILYWLFGDINNIRSRFYDFNHSDLTQFEDSGFVTFDFLNGGSGVLNFSTSVWDKNLESSMTIIAENGAVKIGGQYMDKVEYCHVKNYQMPELSPTNPGNDYGAYKGSAQNHNYVIENVVNVINQRDTITTNALEGLKVVEIIERIYKYSNIA